MKYYEAHITMEGERPKIEALTKAMGWSFSCTLESDPKGAVCEPRSHATKHFNAFKLSDYQVQEELELAIEGLEQVGRVIRGKIELVVFDQRYDRDG